MAARTIIVGGGTAGLACARSLARAGHEVRVFERFSHVHERGSHGGHTRAIRHAYHEGSFYVDLVRRADAAWVDLEGEHEGHLLRRCGLLEFGATDDPDYAAAQAALREAGLRHEQFTAAQASARWPFELPRTWTATLSPDGGYLRVRACLDALRDDAIDHGAAIHYGTQAREVQAGGHRPRVLTQSGRLEAADFVVVAAGAYTQALLPWLRGEDQRWLVRPQRRVLFWRRPAMADVAALSALPIWGAFVPEGFFYGFPHGNEGVEGLKLACHHSRDFALLAEHDDAIDPETLDRTVHSTDRAPVDRFVERFFPTAGRPHAESVCMYASTVSGDFVIDRLPEDPRVVIVGGLSGHGFKFAPVFGELVRELLDGRDAHPAFALRGRRGWT